MDNMDTILVVLDRDNGDNVDVSLCYKKGKEAEIAEAFLYAARDNRSFRRIIESVHSRLGNSDEVLTEQFAPKSHSKVSS